MYTGKDKLAKKSKQTFLIDKQDHVHTYALTRVRKKNFGSLCRERK